MGFFQNLILAREYELKAFIMKYRVPKGKDKQTRK